MRPAPCSSSRRGADAALGPRAVPEAGGPRRRRRAARRPARQEGAPALDGKPYRGKLELVPQGAFLRVVNVVPLESYLQGVVAGEVPVQLAGRGAQGAGGGGALVCAGEPREGEAVRPLLRRAQPGLPRRSRGEAVHHEGGHGHGRRGRALRREGRDDVLLLDVRWKDGERRRRLRLRGSPTSCRGRTRGTRLSPYHRWGPVVLGARTVQAKLGGTARVLDATGSATRSGRLARSSLDDGGRRDVPGLARPNGARPALDVDHGWRDPSRPPVGRHRHVRLVRAHGRHRPLPGDAAARVLAGRLVLVPRRPR